MCPWQLFCLRILLISHKNDHSSISQVSNGSTKFPKCKQRGFTQHLQHMPSQGPATDAECILNLKTEGKNSQRQTSFFYLTNLKYVIIHKTIGIFFSPDTRYTHKPNFLKTFIRSHYIRQMFQIHNYHSVALQNQDLQKRHLQLASSKDKSCSKNEWCFRPWFYTVKATWGWRQTDRMRWMLLWTMPLAQSSKNVWQRRLKCRLCKTSAEAYPIAAENPTMKWQDTGSKSMGTLCCER